MADKRISQLVDRGTVANNDVVPIVVSGAVTTNKATISSIQTFMQGNLDLGVTSVGITLGSSGTDVSVSGSPITTSGNITINIPTASASNRGVLSAANFITFNAKQNAITLTTTGTSGAATLVNSTLNIPNYAQDLSGFVTLGTAQTITAQKTITTNGGSDTFIVNHTSGSGIGVNITKGGNGEGLIVNKTSGSGNAATITGTLQATTIVRTGGTSVQYLMADGSVSTLTNPITGTLATGQVAFGTAANTVGGSNNLFFNNANGRLGIGTSAPADRLSVGNSAGTSISISTNQAAGSVANRLTLDLNFRGFANTKMAMIRSWDESANTGVGYLTFWTNNSGNVFTEKMRILPNGNVGIGTDAPSAKLTSANTGALTLNSNDGNHTGFGLFIQAPTTINTVNSAIGFGGGEGRKYAAIGMQTYADADQVGLNFYVQPSDAGSTGILTESMRITSAGNIGIGTTAPTTRLDIGNGTLTLPTLRGRTYTLTNVSSANPNFINGTGFNAIPVRVGDIIDLPFSQTRTVTAVTNTQLTVDSAWTTSFAGVNVEGRGAIVFQTNNLNRLTIAGTGNVGIGTATPNSKLQVSGSVSYPHSTKTANYTLDATDYTVGFDCASNRTANLPDSTTCAGRIYVIYQYNTNTGSRFVTIDGNGSQTISGLTTVSLEYYEDFSSVMIQSNGSNWIIISDALYFIPL